MATYTNRTRGYEPDGVTIVINVDGELEGVGGTPPDNAITMAKLADLGALSLIGRAANSAGDPAAISAVAASGSVMRESGGTIGFGTLAAGAFADNTIAPARITNQAAKTVLVNATNGAAAVTALAAGTGGHVLRNNAANTALEWGTLLAESYADNTIALARLANAAAPGVVGKFATGAGAQTVLLASAGSDGQALTIQADGSIAWETPAGGGGSIDGSGAATRIAYWSDSDTLTSDAGLTFVAASYRINGQGGTTPFIQLDTSTGTRVGFGATGTGCSMLFGTNSVIITAGDSGNVVLGNNIAFGNFGLAGVSSFNAMQGGIGMKFVAVPTSNAASGTGYLYITAAGGLEFRGSATTTPLAPP